MNPTGWLNRQIASAGLVLESFREEFDRNPTSALDGSRRAFEAAAMRYEATWALAYYNRQGEATTLITARAKLRNATRTPEFSTSPTSNLMAQYTIAALTKIVEKLEETE